MKSPQTHSNFKYELGLNEPQPYFIDYYQLNTEVIPSNIEYGKPKPSKYPIKEGRHPFVFNSNICKSCINESDDLNSYGICSECRGIWTPEKIDQLDKDMGFYKKNRFQGTRQNKTTTIIRYGKGLYKEVSTLIKIGDDVYTPMIAYIPSEDKLEENRKWKKRKGNAKWKDQNFLQKRLGTKKLSTFHNSFPDEPGYQLKRMKSTPTTFCLNPPEYDYGKKCIIPNLKRNDGLGIHLGNTRYGMRNINVRWGLETTEDGYKFLSSFWENEHKDPLQDDIPNDTEILGSDYENRQFSLDEQGIEEGFAEPSHNKLWRKDYIRPFKTPTHRGFMDTKYGRIEIITPLVDEDNEKSFIREEIKYHINIPTFNKKHKPKKKGQRRPYSIPKNKKDVEYVPSKEIQVAIYPQPPPKATDYYKKIEIYIAGI